MPWQQKAMSLIGRPVGVSLATGQGISGILCGMHNGQIFVLQYLYHSQFATMHYTFAQVQDIHPFPSCYPHPR
ncbi:hypothetical protein NST47_29120 [Paenibacillus sp. FSL H8-0034]|uniref:hypothetical protein n=2 Tax=Paenibacillus sp. FSL H8-0034 TaxID=2954671 RepID=UPI0030FC40E2